MHEDQLAIAPLFSLGPVDISSTVISTWIIMVILGVGSWLFSKTLKIEPGPLQTVIEAIISTIENAIAEVAGEHTQKVLPFIATIWIYLVIANLVGLIPGLHSPTRDLSATAALAIIVFLSTHWFGIRIQGLRKYLHHYLVPSPILLPFHLISEISRTVALAVRLFGNIMSLEMAALLILILASFLVPIPILMLHIVEALVQAYIFGMLALIYVAGGIQSQQKQPQNQE